MGQKSAQFFYKKNIFFIEYVLIENAFGSIQFQFSFFN